MTQTKERRKSSLPSDFDWTAHYWHPGEPTKAICGKELLGIPAEDDHPLCNECKRIAKERGYTGGRR